MHSFSRARVGDVEFAAATLEAASEFICRNAASNTDAVAIRFLNSWCVVCAADDASYSELLRSSGVAFADGTPVAALLRFQTMSQASAHVRGPSAMPRVLDTGAQYGLRHFFLGTTSETLRQLEAALRRDYPQAEIAGMWAPPFGPLEGATRVEASRRVLRSGANIVWVGMGSPRQDFAVSAIVEDTGLTAAGVGAAFDFLAGTVSEAPNWMRRTGLEWLFRLISEPRRLWRRYLIGNVRFIVIAAIPAFLRGVRNRGKR